MCNLYALTKSQDEIRRLFEVEADRTGNLPPLPGIFPNTAAPVVHVAEGRRTLSMYRWGMPSPTFALKGKKTDPGVTNVRNTASPHWRRWLGPEHRCLVPLSSFSEFNKAAGGDIWFALAEDRQLACFAGIKTEGWTSVRKVKDGETTDDLYAFLTTEPNAEVGAVHPKAMPVILTTEEERDAWLQAPWPWTKAPAAPITRRIADGGGARLEARRGLTARLDGEPLGALHVRLQRPSRPRQRRSSAQLPRAAAARMGDDV